MKTTKRQIEEIIPAGQIRDERTEQEVRAIWAAIKKLAEKIDILNEFAVLK